MDREQNTACYDYNSSHRWNGRIAFFFCASANCSAEYEGPKPILIPFLNDNELNTFLCHCLTFQLNAKVFPRAHCNIFQRQKTWKERNGFKTCIHCFSGEVMQSEHTIPDSSSQTILLNHGDVTALEITLALCHNNKSRSQNSRSYNTHSWELTYQVQPLKPAAVNTTKDTSVLKAVALPCRYYTQQ